MNLLPGLVYELFGFEELKPTSVTLQLANRSIKTPYGMLEDVLIKIDEFYFLIDFLVLDMELSGNLRQILIILGRPFLAMANVCINYRTGVIDISFKNKKLRLNVFGVSQGPSTNSCFRIDTFENIIKEATSMIFAHDSLYTDLAHFGVDDQI